MYIDIPTPVKQATSKDDTRYGRRGAEVRPGMNGCAWLTTSDGHTAAIMQVEAARCTEPDIIPADVLPGSVKGGKLAKIDGTWETVVTGKQKVKKAEPLDGEFPPVADVIPDVMATKSSRSDNFRYSTAVTINAELLMNIARAIGHDGRYDDTGTTVTLFIQPGEKGKPANKPIAVVGGPGRIGIVMPCNGDPTQARERFDSIRKAYTKAVKA